MKANTGDLSHFSYYQQAIFLQEWSCQTLTSITVEKPDCQQKVRSAIFEQKPLYQK